MRNHKSRRTTCAGNNHQRKDRAISRGKSDQGSKTPPSRLGLSGKGTKEANPPVDGRQIHPTAFSLEKTMARHAKLSVLTNLKMSRLSLDTTWANGRPCSIRLSLAE